MKQKAEPVVSIFKSSFKVTSLSQDAKQIKQRAGQQSAKFYSVKQT
jgi:hypothetical protein